MNSTILVTQIEGGEIGVILSIQHTYASQDLLLQAIREYVNAWAKTPEGKRAYIESSKDFNWGDLSLYSAELRYRIPGVFGAHTIYPSEGAETAIVNHDEVLM